MLNLIKKLVEIPTYSQCKLAVNECINFFENNVKVDYYNNSVLLKNTDSNNFDVISTCHIDVVPMQNNKYTLEKNGNILNGRGVFDMKSFLVSALFNLKKLIKTNSNLKYGIVIATDEETAPESETKYWCNKINTKLVLDSDSGIGNINSIVKDILGAITIKTSYKYDKNLMMKVFGKYYCDFVEDEIDILFDNDNILIELKKYVPNFDVLMFNKCINYDIDNKFHKIYKNIAEIELKTKIDYITVKNTTDSRFFSYKNVPIINHQATGGNYHKIDEWLDYDSLLKFNKIQERFLLELVKYC